jgi:hypothetical protein
VTSLQPEPRKVPGWRLARGYSQTASQRALTASDLAAGVPAQSFTWAEAVRVAGSNIRYLAIVRSFTPQERARVEAGEITISGILRERRRIVAEISKIA